MTQHEFINALRILHSIDGAEIDKALGRPLSGDQWLAFRKDPSRFLMRADGQTSAAIWTVIERRSAPREAASFHGFAKSRRAKFGGDGATRRRVCRSCGCTDDDCSVCIARTGRPCDWVAMDLCSACVPPEAA